MHDHPQHRVLEPVDVLEPTRTAPPTYAEGLTPPIAEPGAHTHARGPVALRGRRHLEAQPVVHDRVRVLAAGPVALRWQVAADIRRSVHEAGHSSGALNGDWKLGKSARLILNSS